MAATLAATPHRIHAVVRDGASVSAALASFAETLSDVLECRVEDRPLVSDSVALRDLLHAQMAFLPREEAERAAAMVAATFREVLAVDASAPPLVDGA